VASGITYTPFGAPLAWTWGNGTTHTRSFDLHGRMTGHPLGADLRTIGYDDAGRITAVNHFPASGLDQGFGYDDLDRLTQATAGSTTRGYAYDLTGNRAQATVNAATDTYTTAATSNRLSGITGSVTRTMSYDATGSITGDGNLTATYDARGRLRTIRIGAAANTTYTYDGLGQRIRKSGGPAGTVNYVYDEDGRLLGEYNSNGVATREYVWLGEMPLAVLSTTETLRDNTAASTSYVGTWGTASTPTGFYGSNYRTHPAQAASPDSVTWNLATSTGTFKVYARWPANGTHSTHAVYRVTHAAGTTDVTVNQRLDGAEWVLLGTFSLSSANSKVTLIPQDDGIVAADAVKAVNTSEASRIFFVHADHLNAPRALMNSTNQLRWRWTSDPFGLVPPEDNPSGLGAFALNLRLPGQVYDIESNLHYNYFRDYDPGTGRYTQSDPIGLAGGINTYAYVSNQPTRFTDPKGLVKWAGEMYAATFVSGGGSGQYWFDLKSECVNGKYAYIRVYASALGVGLGIKYTGTASSVSFDDHLSELHPEGFEGTFKIVSAGLGFILTGSWSVLQLGNNYADFSFVPTPGIGVDASVTALIGRSVVVSKDIKDCACNRW
jgi:RHS repeat-associated protein